MKKGNKQQVRTITRRNAFVLGHRHKPIVLPVPSDSELRSGALFDCKNINVMVLSVAIRPLTQRILEYFE